MKLRSLWSHFFLWLYLLVFSSIASVDFIGNVYIERDGYAVYQVDVFLHGVASDIGPIKIHYCDIIRYKDKVKQFVLSDVKREKLWDESSVEFLISTVRGSLLARAVDMDKIDRIYYPSSATRPKGEKDEDERTISIYDCDHTAAQIIKSGGISFTTADEAVRTLVLNGARNIPYTYSSSAGGELSEDGGEYVRDKGIYYFPFMDYNSNNNPFLDINFLFDVFSNFRANDRQIITFSDSHNNYESLSAILWNVLHKQANTFVDVNYERPKSPLIIVYKSLNTESGGSLAMRQLYADILSLILPFTSKVDPNNTQESIVLFCDDNNVDHKFCVGPPLTSLVITGEWCSGVLTEHQALEFTGLGLQWFLGFHHRNDFCKGRVRMAHTRYLQNNIATTVFGGYFLGCSMNNAIKPYILDFIYQSGSESANDPKRDGILPPIVKENLVVIDGDINTDYPLKAGFINFTHIFALINQNRVRGERINFVIAKGYSYGDLLNLLARSKLAIDLAFPGAERLTSEAALLGTLVIGSRRWNSGGLYDHPGIVKIDPANNVSELLDIIPHLLDNYEDEIQNNINFSRFHSYVLSQWRRSYYTTDVIVSSTMLHLIFIISDSKLESEYEALLSLLAYLYLFPTITIDVYVKCVTWFMREHYMFLGMLQESGYIKFDPQDPDEHASWVAEEDRNNARIRTGRYPDAPIGNRDATNDSSGSNSYVKMGNSGGISFINIIDGNVLIDKLAENANSQNFDLSYLLPPSSKGKVGMIVHDNAVFPQALAVKQAVKALLNNDEANPSNLLGRSVVSLGYRSDAAEVLNSLNMPHPSPAVTVFYNNKDKDGNNIYNQYITQLLINEFGLLDSSSSSSGDANDNSEFANFGRSLALDSASLSVDLNLSHVCSLYKHNISNLPPSQLPFVYSVTRSVNWIRVVTNIGESEISKTLCNKI